MEQLIKPEHREGSLPKELKVKPPNFRPMFFYGQPSEQWPFLSLQLAGHKAQEFIFWTMGSTIFTFWNL